MTRPAPAANSLSYPVEGDDMGRRRGQRKGYLRPENGNWLLTYRIYTREFIRGKRITVTIGPSDGPGKLSKKQAERFAFDHYLKPLDTSVARPMTTLTVSQFWEQKYLPHLRKNKKYATQTQYISLWRRWIEPVCGNVRLFEVIPAHIDKAIGEALAAKKSTATAKHVRKVASAVFQHAKRSQCFSGDNPAQCVECPEVVLVKRIRALSPEQCNELLAALPEPARTMALMMITISCNISELLGLEEQNINFTDEYQLLEGGDSVPPHWVSVRMHVYHGRRGSLKTGKRRRDLPMSADVEAALKALIARNLKRGPDAPVFQTTIGTVQSADNLRKRVFCRVVERINEARRDLLSGGTPGSDREGEMQPFPPVTWNVLRHTHATLSKHIGMSDYDRSKLMGHGSVSMTDRYTDEDRLRLESGVERIAAAVAGRAKRNTKVVSIG